MDITSGDFGSNVDAFDAITRTALVQNYNVAVGGGPRLAVIGYRQGTSTRKV